MNGMTRSPGQPADQTGVVLVLTLIFVIIIAFVLLALVSLSGNDLENTSNLQSQRASEYAADSAVDAAVQAVRYSYYAFNSTQSGAAGNPCVPNTGKSGFANPNLPCYTNYSGDDCLPDGTTFINPDQNAATMTINGITMTVDCTGDLYPTSQNTRQITFYACQHSNCSSTNSTLTATVWFQDYPTSFSVPQDPCNSSPNVADCGTGIVIQSWVVRNANS
jgi:Tfp pilus assembly protein PilX